MSRTIPRRGPVVLVLAAAASTTSCAFEAGEPYGLVSATLDARYVELADRATPDGFEKLNTDFQVRLTSAILVVDAVELIDSGAGAEVPTFDPANPPPGYSLCHGGHCHADDGSLVDYDTIAAELAAGTGSTQTTAATMVPGAVDLLAPLPIPLACTPDCALDEGHLVLTRITASRLRLRGEVRDSRGTPRIDGVFDWQVDLALLEPLTHDDEADEHDQEEHSQEAAPGTFELRLDLPIAEDEPPNIALALALPTNAKLLDRIDFSAVEPTPSRVIDLDAYDGANARAELANNFADIDAVASATRTAD